MAEERPPHMWFTLRLVLRELPFFFLVFQRLPLSSSHWHMWARVVKGSGLIKIQTDSVGALLAHVGTGG